MYAHSPLDGADRLSEHGLHRRVVADVAECV
jgi:hypothetical protein